MTEEEATKEAGLDEDWVTGNINEPIYQDDVPLPPKNTTLTANLTVPANSTVSRKLARVPINQTEINQTDDIFPTATITDFPTLISSPTQALQSPNWTMHGGASTFNPANYMASSLVAYALVMTGWLLIFASVSRYIRAKKMAEIAMLGSTAPASVNMPVADPIPVVVPLEQLSHHEMHSQVQLEHEVEPNIEEGDEETGLTTSQT
jgi:hypothetical protein